tara:strand:+ start:62 stop:442 length:381 start_codon:yes stop_codon:yes gene_type:complete
MASPIANLVSQIKNGYNSSLASISLSKTKKVLNIIEVLYKNGLVSSYKVEASSIKVYLKYTSTNTALINDIKGISTPGNKTYIKAKDLKLLTQSFTIFILSTPAGYLTHEEALKQNLGGELLLSIK